MRRKAFVVILTTGIVLLLTGAAIETVEWFQENKIINTTSDIFSAYLDARDDFPPIPLPMGADDLLSRMEANDWSFLNDHWFFTQTGSSLYVSEDSKLAKQLKLPVQVLVVEDITRSEITIYVEDKKGGWKGLALFDAPPILDETVPFYATLSAEEKQQDLFWNLNATRVRWMATLKPESDLLADFVFQRDAVIAPVSLPEEGGMMAMMSVPPEHTNNIWISGEAGSSGFDLEVYCPSGVTNIELYRCSDLLAAEWVVEKVGLMAVNTNVVSWTVSTEEDTGFFIAGNGGLDTDQDSIPDAQEHYVQKTDSDKWDTDGDWLSDGWEITNSLDALTSDSEEDDDNDGLSNGDEYQWGTDPFDEDSDDDGLSDGDEIALGTDPNKSDTDGDSLPDAWEVRFGYDPASQSGALSGADQVGQFDTLGSALAVEVHGDIAYLADGTNGLVIVDVRHPGGLELSSLPLEGEANDLLLTNDRLWVALGEYGVAAVDVSDPFRPYKLGSHYTGGYTRGLALQSNLLYVANTEKDLLIFDVEYLDEIVQVGGYGAYAHEGRDVCVSGTNCWLAFDDRVYQLDVSDVAEPQHVNNIGASSYDVQDTQLAGSNIYVSGGVAGFSIWNADLNEQERIGYVDTEHTAYGFGLESNRVLLAEGMNFIELLSVSNEASPVVITNCVINGFANDAELRGERGYVAAGEGGLTVLRFATDNDADGMDDNWEIQHFGSTNAVATNDFDGDGIFNREEYVCGMNPTNTDSDADGLSDYAEVWTHISDPTRADGDLDGLSDYAEIYTNGTQAGNADTDGDGMIDGWEVEHNFNPLLADGTGDSDSDGLSNLNEYLSHTDPSQGDSDGDDLSDAWEVLHGTANESTNYALRDSFEQVATRNTDGEAHGVLAEGDWLYVADGTNGLVVFDRSTPSAPEEVATLNTAGFAYDVIISNQYAYVADGTNGLVIVSVSNPASPSITGQYNTDGTAYGLDIKGGYVYIADGANELVVVDVSDPENPEFESGAAWTLQRDFFDIALAGDFAYVGAEQNVYKLDISGPADPTPVGAAGFFTGINVWSVYIANGKVYAVLSDDTVRTINGGSMLEIPSSSYAASDTPRDVFVTGDTMYVSGKGGIEFVDISVAEDAVRVLRHLTYGDGNAVVASANHVYMADGSNGVAVFRFVEDSDEDGLSDFWEIDHFGDLSQTATNDFDGDGISNWGEFLIAGNPATNDADGDLLSDYAEIWTYQTQPLMADTDEDGRGDYEEVNGSGGVAATDPLDADSDDDELNDGGEVSWLADPHDTDTDDDAMPDGWEVANGLNPTNSNASADFDSDGLLNLAEYQAGTKANDPDTDDDDLDDGDEMTAGTEPLNPDTDGDGLTDGAEVNTHYSNPLDPDSDTDGLPDGWEVTNGLSPTSNSATNDFDGDGLTNEEEYQAGSMANNTDSDGDGLNDYYEVNYGLNPVSDDTDGDGINDQYDDQPGVFEAMIPSVVTNEISYSVHYGSNNGSSPKYAGTYTFSPTNLPTNATLNITNVVLDGWTVYDAFRIYKDPARTHLGYENFGWEYGPSQGTNDITELVELSLGGEVTNGFEIDLYHWFATSGPQDEHADISADCIIKFQKAVPMALVPDYDRDGVIDTNDMGRTYQNERFRFWVNDDNDSGYDGGQDIPGQGDLNNGDLKVNGVRDLIDFFPVYLNISNLVEELPVATHTYYLRHAGAALNGVETGLTPDEADGTLRDVSTANGLANASLHLIGTGGWELSTNFVDSIRTNGQGIILVEATKPTTEPLRLTVYDTNAQIVAECALQLSISGVEKMYNRVNLRNTGEYPQGSVSITPAENLPGGVDENKHFIFVHGYSVNEEAARGWQAEMFKRMWWSGNNAVFHGVTWRGNTSQLPEPIPWLGGRTPDYHVNVLNALNASPFLKNYIDGPYVQGHTVLAGHSLGSMLSGAAVAVQGANVDRFFMINGAVAIENFDSSAGVQNTNMVHPDWLDYNDRLWCSEWHDLFNGTGDFREYLTWRNYFAAALTNTYNFYSSGEEVLKTHVGDPGPLDYATGGEAWCLQEKRKGRNWVTSIGGSTYGGWGFNSDYYGHPPWYAGTNHVQLTNAGLKRNPFFRPGDGYLLNLYDSHNGDNFAEEEFYTLLSGFVPARTLPCGANEVGALGTRNFNMNAMQNGWPRGNSEWRHSDIRVIAYPYVHEVFDEIVDEGEVE